MDKVDDYISKIPGIIVKMIQEQQNVRQYRNYFKKVGSDIKYFQQHGTFPKLSDAVVENCQNTKRTVLTENAKNNAIQIKLERISEISHDEAETDSGVSDIQKENVNPVKLEMPPPQLPIKKNRKIKKEPSISNTRSTHTRAPRQVQKDSINNLGRESDVILETQEIKTFTILSDSDNEDSPSLNKGENSLAVDKNNAEETSTRKPRTKTRTKKKKDNVEKVKRTRSSSNKDEPVDTEAPRQTKRKKKEEYSDEEENINNVDLVQAQKNYIRNNLDKTVIIKKDVNNTTIVLEKKTLHTVDKTVIIDKPKVLANGYSTPDLNNILTDDNTPAIVPKKATVDAKPIFNVFDESPVKKHVEAFEKLRAEDTSYVPVRITRLKTKTKAEGKEQKVSTLTPKFLKQNRGMKTTPQMANRYLATVSSSANKTIRTKMTNESFLSVKSLSALKASQQEFNERENKRREKEGEAMKKRVQQVHAQIEEKKKKHLEKQIKAQQMSELHEKSKSEALKEAEKAKEERHHQILAEQEEKLKKQQEESERRRLEVLKKALEEKRKEEEKQKAVEETQEKLKDEKLRKALQEERRNAKALEHKKKTRGRMPIFLREKAPLLPTEDCYDSDQEDADVQKARRPAWTSSKRTFPKLEIMNCVEKRYVSCFFVMAVTTPDLQDIFENIDPTKLKRTSSAIWKAPPRYTMMSDSIQERDEEDC